MENKHDILMEKLAFLFEDMFQYVGKFRKKTYDDIFHEGFERHSGTIDLLTEYIESSEDSAKAVEEVAEIIPAYIVDKTKDIPKKKREKDAVEYNMNMAVYVIPFLRYGKNEFCEQVAQKTVEKWNEAKITDMTLGVSNYEVISSGFKHKWCFVTTAVCQSMGKPDDCYELQVLRNYRDAYMMKTETGADMVKSYYDIAPAVVFSINLQNNSKDIYRDIYASYLTPCIRHIEEGDKELCLAKYKEMIQVLSKKYLCSGSENKGDEYVQISD